MLKCGQGLGKVPDSKYLGSVPLFCVRLNIPTRPFLKNDCSMYVKVGWGPTTNLKIVILSGEVPRSDYEYSTPAPQPPINGITNSPPLLVTIKDTHYITKDKKPKAQTQIQRQLLSV